MLRQQLFASRQQPTAVDSLKDVTSGVTQPARQLVSFSANYPIKPKEAESKSFRYLLPLPLEGIGWRAEGGRKAVANRQFFPPLDRAVPGKHGVGPTCCPSHPLAPAADHGPLATCRARSSSCSWRQP